MQKIEPPANTLYVDHLAYQSTITALDLSVCIQASLDLN